MNKKSLKVLLTALISLGATSSFAAMNIPLGVGSVSGSSNQVAELPLSALNADYVYQINCVMNNPTGNKMAAKLRVDLKGISNVDGDMSYTTFDGMPNSTHQFELSDTQSHTYTIGNLSPVPAQMSDIKPTLRVIWLAGEDVATPVSYDCSATPAVGKKK